MKVFTSYFYQIRNFKPNMIPLSTAVSDPEWFHDGQGKLHVFLDKNNVYNGFRCCLMPGQECNGLCHGKDNCEIKDPTKCEFLQKYKEQLNSLDFNDLMIGLEQFAKDIQRVTQFKEEPYLVFIVYEAPNNTCSERQVIQKYFNSHGVECLELKYPIKENY